MALTWVSSSQINTHSLGFAVSSLRSKTCCPPDGISNLSDRDAFSVCIPPGVSGVIEAGLKLSRRQQYNAMGSKHDMTVSESLEGESLHLKPTILSDCLFLFLLPSPRLLSPRPGASRSGKVPVGIAARGFAAAISPGIRSV